MLVCGLEAKRGSGQKEVREACPRAYTVWCPNLSVRLKKFAVFSLFRTENWWFFCVFHTVFYPPREERMQIKYTGNCHNWRRIQCFVTVKSVFINRHYIGYLRQLLSLTLRYQIKRAASSSASVFELHKNGVVWFCGPVLVQTLARILHIPSFWWKLAMLYDFEFRRYKSGWRFWKLLTWSIEVAYVKWHLDKCLLYFLFMKFFAAWFFWKSRWFSNRYQLLHNPPSSKRISRRTKRWNPFEMKHEIQIPRLFWNFGWERFFPYVPKKRAR
jgi:hypothetical protein